MRELRIRARGVVKKLSLYFSKPVKEVVLKVFGCVLEL